MTNMSYVFESVEYKNDFSVKAFVTGIKSSSFHWHYEYELLNVLQGRLTVCYGSKISELKEGDVILINSKCIHSISADCDNTVIVLQLGRELFTSCKDKNAVFNFYLDSVQNAVPPKCEYSKIIKQMAKIVHGVQTADDERCKNSMSSYRIRAEIDTLVADLMDYVEHDVSFQSSDDNSSLQDAITYIDYMKNHLQDFDVLGDLCEKFKISRKTLDRNMQSCVALSSKDMLEILRIDMAKRLLSSTDKSPAYIIDDCGFGSEKTFYRIFKEKTRLTPFDYRKQGEQEMVKNVGDQLRSYLRVENEKSEKLLQKFMQNLENS